GDHRVLHGHRGRECGRSRGHCHVSARPRHRPDRRHRRSSRRGVRPGHVCARSPTRRSSGSSPHRGRALSSHEGRRAVSGEGPRRHLRHAGSPLHHRLLGRCRFPRSTRSAYRLRVPARRPTTAPRRLVAGDHRVLHGHRGRECGRSRCHCHVSARPRHRPDRRHRRSSRPGVRPGHVCARSPTRRSSGSSPHRGRA
ncbi:hypothetical protein EMIHUDRAFT_432177, partial [Emiliania huxleyi CCMP1516]|uniref:Uncharacterized protein n=2 Tax=Emiliania huxleyi TaxID=2903 RepID=A0A0D3JHY1_EMIH1